MRIVAWVACGLLVLALLGAGVATTQLNRFLNAPMANTDPVDLEVPSGASFGGVTRRLVAAGLISDDGLLSDTLLLRLYARYTDQAADVQAGDYRVAAGTTPVQLLEQLTSGDVRLYSFTIIEGWNQWLLLDALRAAPHIEATLTDEDWPAFLAELGSGYTHPEGLFLPETYFFPGNTTDRELLKQAHEHLLEVLDAQWPERDPSVSLQSPYEALILASIIEKETGRADERQRISGVFHRRLGINMRLQTDPTVIYGIGKDFNGNLTRRDLRTDTPYNTYRRGGLPPTPIAMAGEAAIYAALHPEEGDELYFVATGLGDGSHKFSLTREEHEAAVAVYLKRLRQARSEGQ